jgi:hypothetical protein
MPKKKEASREVELKIQQANQGNPIWIQAVVKAKNNREEGQEHYLQSMVDITKHKQTTIKMG